MDGTLAAVRELQNRLTRLNNELDEVESNTEAARLVRQIKQVEATLDLYESEAARCD